VSEPRATKLAGQRFSFMITTLAFRCIASKPAPDTVGVALHEQGQVLATQSLRSQIIVPAPLIRFRAWPEQSDTL